MSRPQSIVVKIVLAEQIPLFTDDNNYKLLDLKVEALENLLPNAASMTLEVLLDQVATNQVDWNIDAYAGWDRDHELAAAAFFAADQATAGPQLLAVTNVVAATHYMQHLRLVLKWRLRAGVTVPKRPFWSANLYVTLKN